MTQQHSHSFIYLCVGKVNGSNICPADLPSKLVDVSDELAYVGGVQSLEVFVEKGCYFLGFGREEAFLD